ncbi:ABC transporter permease [Mangrovicella endophytica]|uniref:ABC transporter permease n=1 Tax=Mangrovicella endophytica TaxID=2066697 RepID=UPI001FE1793A|nr:ABC transporter permease [Mangrovicella endophytica]
MAQAVRAGRRGRAGMPQVVSRGGLLSFLVVLGLWALATGPLDLVGPARFPSPADFWQSGVQIVTRGYAGGTLLTQVWHSLRLVLFGFVVASATGVGLGLLMGLSPRAEKLINPTFLLLRPIPPLAWIPLAILWFGLGDAAKIFVIWYAAFVPSVINTLTGVRGVDRTILSAAEVHGASRSQLVRDVVIPAALPMIFTGLRLSLQACWTTLVAAELVGAFFGIGRVLMTASQDVNPGMILFAMVCVAILGAGTTWLLGTLERRAMPWRQA